VKNFRLNFHIFYSYLFANKSTLLIVCVCVCMCLQYFRNLLGEDLGPLSSKDLEQLERQLDSSLKQVRSTKVFVLENK